MSHRFHLLSATMLLAGLLFSIRSEASSLDTLFARGDSAIAVTWTPDSINTRAEWYQTNGAKCTGADSIYRHCDFIPGETYHSIAYSYGGEDGYIRFRDKIAEGFLVGSHLCHYNTFGDPSKAVAGTDCSGFICHLLEAPRVSTREFYSQYDVISREEMDVGDILVKSGSHAVIIIGKEDADNFLIWESTSVVNGCRERMIDITDSYWDAYYPRRYPGLSTRTAATIPRNQGFPAVSVRGALVTLLSSDLWNGTLTVSDLAGRVLITAVQRLGNSVPATVRLPGNSPGTFLFRFTSTAGKTLTRPVILLPR